MRKMLVVFILAGLAGCKTAEEREARQIAATMKDIQTLEIDGHEYLVFGKFRFNGGICHKQNCRFCAAP